ncbi:MAG: hypothetical protein ACWIPJ_04440 [Polaribacter sp.]
MVGQLLKYGKRYAAIEHAEKGSFNLLQLTKKKDEFVISKNKQTDSFEVILEELKGQKHLFLIINDTQVLSKKIASTTSETISMVRTAFPNISLSDFYYEVYTTGTASFVSIARKEMVDTLISNYKKAGISVIDFSLGNIVIKNLEGFIANKTLFSSNAKIDFNENTIQEIHKKLPLKERYLINDLEISNTDVLPLGGIIAYYSKNLSSIISKELKESYTQKHFFNLGLKAGLGFLLCTLLINFIFFSSYRNQVGNLTRELQLSKTYKNQLNNLQNKVTQKKQLVKSVNSASKSKLSKYIDEIGISVPNTVLLTQIEYQPKNGIQKSEKKLQFESNKMFVKGTSKDNEAFTKWISVLEKTAWIKNISINEYGKGKKTTSIANFAFIITTDNE